MRRGAILTLILALVLGGLAVFLVQNWVQRHAHSVAVAAKGPSIALTTVVVATRSLKFGDKLQPALLDQAQWPAASTPKGSFKTIEQLFKQDKNRVVLKPIAAQEPVLVGSITGPGQRASLSSLISGSMRAVTIRVNDVVGVAGFVLPGDHVDVLLTRRVQGSQQNSRTDIIIQDIKVLGIDQNANENRDKPQVVKAVTVEVTPEQAQKLSLAEQVGRLTLALRSDANVAVAKARTITTPDLSTGGSAPPPAPEPVVAHDAPPPIPVKRAVVAGPSMSSVTVVRALKVSKERVVSEPSGSHRERPAVKAPAKLQPESLGVGTPAKLRPARQTEASGGQSVDQGHRDGTEVSSPGAASAAGMSIPSPLAP